jgi:ATP-dependent Clp protease ATP-binding subunit ClpA
VEERIKSFFVDEVLFGRLEAGGHARADYIDGEYRIEITTPQREKLEEKLTAE